ncbi:MAG TPA: N-acetylglucosamine-6-phosphate deacetylase [bacterium]|nr:N-acetylglucosamine-6-phosphate deacetylase [bacterium]HOM26820.1 N-acetylglucosamine-6-phosphate deacetylase [bacterium]
MDRKNKFLIKNITLINPGEKGKVVDVYVEGKTIKKIGKDLRKMDVTIEGRGKLLIPGLIDLHIQGAGGTDFLNLKDNENVQKISSTLASLGTTSFLATTIFKPYIKKQKHIERIVENTEKVDGAKILGIHLEGPYINVKRKGMIKEDKICSVRERSIEEIIEICGGKLKMMTFAPEIEGIKSVVKKLIKNNVVPSIGHTDATFDETEEMIKMGVNHVTHLFNAMRPFHHREPGVIGAVLFDNNFTYQIICDGKHIHPEVVNYIFKIKGPENFCIITDGISALGLPDGNYMYKDIEYFVKEGTGYYKDGTLIGTAFSQLNLMKKIMEFTGLPFEEILKTATTVPAKVIGISDKKGIIEKGKDADMVILDKNLNVEITFVEGKIVYRKEEKYGNSKI